MINTTAVSYLTNPPNCKNFFTLFFKLLAMNCVCSVLAIKYVNNIITSLNVHYQIQSDNMLKHMTAPPWMTIFWRPEPLFCKIS